MSSKETLPNPKPFNPAKTKGESPKVAEKKITKKFKEPKVLTQCAYPHTPSLGGYIPLKTPLVPKLTTKKNK